MSVENLLNNLQKVKKVGPDKWIARCPAHDDKNPSLSIKDSGGTVLLKCWSAGCGAMDIVGALGLDPSELFPPNDGSWQPDQKRHAGFAKFTAMDGLRCLSHEGGLISIMAADMAEGKVLSIKERERLEVACGRIAAALEYLDGN